MSIRIRCNPSVTDILRDSLDFSDSAVTTALACTDDIMTWFAKVCSIPSVRSMQDQGAISRKRFQEHLNDICVKYKGKSVLFAQAIQTCSPYFNDPCVMDAWSELLRIAPKMNEATKIMKFCALAGRFTAGNHDEASRLIIWGMQVLANHIYFNDMLDEDTNVRTLIGKGKNVCGMMHVIFSKFYIVQHLLSAHECNVAQLSNTGPTTGSLSMIDEQSFRTPGTFRKQFEQEEKAEPDGQEEEVAPDGQENAKPGYRARHGFRYYYKDMFISKTSKLLPSVATITNLLFELMTPKHDASIIKVIEQNVGTEGCLLGSIVLEKFFNTESSCHEPTEISRTFQTYLGSVKPELDPFLQHGVPNASQPLAVVTDNDDNKSIKESISSKLLAMRKEKTVFHAPADGHFDFSCKLGLSKFVNKMKFENTRDETQSRRLFLIAADMFMPNVVKEQGCKDYIFNHAKSRSTKMGPEFAQLLEWVLSVKRPADCVLVCDGRLRQARKIIDEAFSKLDPALVEDIWVTYDTPCRKKTTDFRNISRRMAYASNLRETMYLALPKIKRSGISIKSRVGFNKCGEESSHNLTYSGVTLRSIFEMPTLSIDLKKQIIGNSSVQTCYPDKAEVEAFRISCAGVPLTWHETKSVEFFKQVLADLPDVKYIFDFCPGSGAAAFGALCNDMHYECICANTSHKDWLENVMDMCMHAVVTTTSKNRKTDDHDFTAKVRHFCGPQVEQGMKFMKEDPNRGQLQHPQEGESDCDNDEF